ncbi:MAG: ribbon-helix-helix domain-containing protein, partial [Chloroflexota bacterium]|nr:ribbon-helix-helix domain-containing protein [Chloroflexota bacterium]
WTLQSPLFPLDIKDSCFSLPPEMFEQVDAVRREEGRDMSELVREALRLYMEERELRREARLERLRSRLANQSEEDGGHIDE